MSSLAAREGTATVPAHPYADVPLVVLSGLGRSGTTALRAALSAHPAFDSTGNENNVLYDLLDAAWRNRTIPARRYALRVPEARYDALFRRLVLDLLWPNPRPEHARPARLLAYTNLEPVRAAYLAELFRGVRIVYIVRHGVEVVASRLLHDGFADRDFAAHCAVWAGVAPMVAWGAERNDFLLVRHEELLERDATVRMFDRLARAIGVPPAPACVAALHEDRIVHPTQHPAESSEEADDLARRRSRWRFWSDEERRCFEETCGATLRSLGWTLPWRDEPAPPAAAPAPAAPTFPAPSPTGPVRISARGGRLRGPLVPPDDPFRAAFLRERWRRLGVELDGGPVAIFGAGQHTRRLLERIVHGAPGPSVAWVLDDAAAPDDAITGVPVVRPEAADPRVVRAVIASSDVVEPVLAERAAAWARTAGAAAPTVVRLYEGVLDFGTRPA